MTDDATAKAEEPVANLADEDLHPATFTTEELATTFYAAFSSSALNEGGLAAPPWSGLTEAQKQSWRAVANTAAAIL